jgi:uncharacterized membrane protein
MARVIAGWDAGALVYLPLAWILASQSDSRMTRDHALAQDLGRYLIFLFIVSASFASVVALGFVVGPSATLPSGAARGISCSPSARWRRRGS